MKLRIRPETRAALVEQGWSEERSVDVSDTVSRLRRAGYAVDDYMTEVLASLSGITLEPIVERGVNFRNDDPLVVDPIGAGERHREEARSLEEWFKVPFCPLGWWLCYSHVFFSTPGTSPGTSLGTSPGTSPGTVAVDRAPDQGRHLVFDGSAGIVVASARDVVWDLGEDLGSALDLVALANRPLVRLWSMDQMED